MIGLAARIQRASTPEHVLRKWSRAEATLRGWVAERVDHYDSRTHRSHDLLGIFDMLAFDRDTTIGVQYTTSSNMAARIRKLRASLYLDTVKAARWRVLVWGWRRDGTFREEEL